MLGTREYTLCSPFRANAQKSLCIAFLTISDQYHNFYFCEVFLDVRKSLWITSLAILDQYRFLFLFIFCYKMAVGGHFGCPKFTLDHISGHF